MLPKFLQRRGGAAANVATIPSGRRVYAVGDIHGCDVLLDELLTRIDDDDRARHPAETTLIFLGDLIDRGPASAAVVERLRHLAELRPRTHFLMGNHEEIFLEAVQGESKALRLFCRIGGRETAISYGIDPRAYDRMDYEQLADALASLVPPSHLDFVGGFENMITIGDYVFVHAGVRPDTAFAEQKPRDLRWIRDSFLDHGRPLDKMVVHGHTISAALDRQVHRIGVDTGAYETGCLTALGLEGAEVWTLDTASVERA